MDESAFMHSMANLLMHPLIASASFAPSSFTNIPNKLLTSLSSAFRGTYAKAPQGEGCSMQSGWVCQPSCVWAQLSSMCSPPHLEHLPPFPHHREHAEPFDTVFLAQLVPLLTQGPSGLRGRPLCKLSR